MTSVLSYQDSMEIEYYTTYGSSQYRSGHGVDFRARIMGKNPHSTPNIIALICFEKQNEINKNPLHNFSKPENN